MKRTLQTFVILLMLLCTSGMYAQMTSVMSEDFESGLPAGWTQEYVVRPVTSSNDSTLYSWAVESCENLVYPSGCVSGSHCIVAANTTNTTMNFRTMLISPVFSLTGISRPQITFHHAEPRKAANCDTLRLYYRTSVGDVWRELPDAEYTRNNNWQETTIALISPGPTYQVAFEISEGMGRGVMLDAVSVHPTPMCQNVQNIVFTNIHAYDVSLTWTAFGAYDQFEVLVADTALNLEAIERDHIVQYLNEDIYDPAAYIEGLEPDHTYYVYIRSDCSETSSGFTDWTSASFRTLKVAYLPYQETFNNTTGIQGNIAYAIPDGWTIGNNLNTTVPMVLRTSAVSANAMYSVDSTCYLGFVGAMSATPAAIPASSYAYAVTPEIVDTVTPGANGVTSLRGLEVQFWLTAANFVSLGTQTYGGELIVGTITDPLDIRSFHPLDTVRLSTTNLFRHVCINLNDYAGTDKFIALLSRSDMANAMFVDNFTLSKPAVFVPTNVRLSQVNSMGFTVTPEITAASSWDLLISSEYSRTGEVPDLSIVERQRNLTTASYTFSQAGLENQIVYVYTRAHSGEETSEWSFAKTVRIPSKMPVLSETLSDTLSFSEINNLVLNTLEPECRIPGSYAGLSSVYYPLGAVDADINTFPRSSSARPEYRGPHAQLCGADSWFVLPEATDLNTLKMVFRYASQANLRGKLAIGVMTDPYDLATFEQMAVFDADGAEYLRCLVSFEEYTGSGKFIAFRSLNAGSGAASSTNLIDEIVISKLGMCREASNVNIEAHHDRAIVTWTGGGMDGWIVGIDDQKSMMNATYNTVTTPQVIFNDLEQEKKYYITIQTICNGEEVDLDDMRYAFITPHGLPFTEGFSGTIPTGWTRSTTSANSVFSGTPMNTSTSGWGFSQSSTYANPAMDGFVAYRSLYDSSNDYAWLVSPELYVDADPQKPLELVFDLGMTTYSSSAYVSGEAGPNDWFMVAVSEDGGNTWLRSNATIWNNTGTGNYVLNDLLWDGAEQIRVDFTKFIGKRIKFAFYVEGLTSNHHDYLVIDNIILREGDERCGGLTNLHATAPTLQSGEVTWQRAGINPWPVQVQLSTNSSFATRLHDDEVDGTSITYTDLLPNTTYYVRAHQNCTNDSEWKVTSFNTPCMAVTPDAFGTETFDQLNAINCWTVGYIQTRTIGDLPTASSTTQYGNVLVIAKTSTDEEASNNAYAISPELEIDDNVKDISHYQVIFKAATNKNNVETNIHRLRVGIVSDRTDVDYTWEDIVELDLQYAADSTELKTYVVSFENYHGDQEGVMGHYIGFRVGAGTDSTNYVIIDDVMVTDAEGCHMVLDLGFDSITSEGCRLHWTGNGIQYEIGISDSRVNPDTCQTWLFHQRVSGTSYNVTGLEPSTRYFAYIRAICDEGETGRWSSATYFKTAHGLPYLETFDELTSYLAEGNLRQATGVHFPGDSVILTPELKTPSTYSGGWLLDAESNYTTISGISGKIAKMDMYSTYSFWLVLPTLDLGSAQDALVNFSAKVALCSYSGGKTPAASSDDRLGVIVSLDGGTTWYKRDATFWSADGTGNHPYNFGLQAQRIEVDMTDYSGKSVTIAILGESTASGSDNWLIVDSISVQKVSSECLGVRNASFELMDDSHAVARWHIVGSPKDVVYELSESSDFSTILVSDTTAADSAVISNLALNTIYYLRLTQVNCTTSRVLTIRTPYAIPFEESFNIPNVPSAWTIFTGNADSVAAGTLLRPVNTQPWKISTSNIGLPANHLKGELYYGTSQNEMWLVSPDIIIPQGSENVKLAFDLALTAEGSSGAPGSTDGQEFRVLVSRDKGMTWASADQWVFSNAAGSFMTLSDVPTTGRRIQLPMDAFVGQTVRFAFYKAATANDNDLHIANVKLMEMGEPCDAPTNVQVSDISFTQATVTWEALEDKVTVVELSPLVDFSAVRRDTIISGMSKTFTGLNSGATYFVRVKQICAANSISDYSDVVTFITPLGLPYNNAFGSLDNWSTKWSPYASDLAGVRRDTTKQLWSTYTDPNILNGAPHIYCGINSQKYISWLISPELDLTPQEPGTTITMAINLALTKSYKVATHPDGSNWMKDVFMIAVSTDNGETFENANAYVFSSDASADFVYADIPAGAGKTYQLNFSKFAGQKIRIALVKKAKVASCINIDSLKLDVVTSSCFGVSNVVASQIDTAATLTLTKLDESQNWEMAYGPQGTPLLNMPVIQTDVPSIRIYPLLLNTTYDVYARSICGVEDTSRWSGPYTFTTPHGVPFESGLENDFNNWVLRSANPDSVAAGKDTLVVVTKGWTKSGSTTQALGAKHVYCAQDKSVYYWLISPEINLMPQDGSKGIWLSMNMALTSTSSGTTAPRATDVANHTFRVIVSEDGGETWPAANTILWGRDTTVADYVYSSIPGELGKAVHLDLSRYAGKNIRIAFVQGASATGSSYIHINHVELAEYSVPCWNLKSFEVTMDGAIAHCVIEDENATATAWQYVFGPRGFTPSDTCAVTVNGKNFDIENLTVSSTLDIYMRSLCSEEDNSGWVGPVTVKTPIGVPYYEGLTDYSSLPEDWSTLALQSNGTWGTSSSYQWSMGKGSYVWNMDHAAVNNWSTYNAMLVSPAINMYNISREVKLTFDLALTHYNSSQAPASVESQTFTVRVSTDGGETFEPIAVWGGSSDDFIYGAIPATGATYEVDLTEFAGESIILGFHSSSLHASSTSDSNDNDLHLRNVRVDTTENASIVCGRVRGLTQLDAQFHSVQVAFRGAGIAEAMSREYVCLPHDAIFSARNAMHTDSTIVTISGLEASSTYDVYARLQCADSTWMPWNGPFEVTTATCTAITGITPVTISFEEATVNLVTVNPNAAAGYEAILVRHGEPRLEEMAQLFSTRKVSFVQPLEPDASYDLYARKICEPGVYSEWSEAFVINTPHSVPYSDDLNWTELNEEWSRYSGSLNSLTSTTSGWSFGREGSVFDNNHAYVSTAYSANKYLLASPAIDMSLLDENAKVNLTFDAGMLSGSSSISYDNITFSVVVESDNSWETVISYAESNNKNKLSTLTSDGTAVSVDMSNYVGKRIRFGFYYEWTSSANSNMSLHVANVSLDTLSLLCPRVENVQVKNLTLQGATVTFDFSDGSSVGDAWIEVALDGNFMQLVEAKQISGTSVQLTSLQPSTTYYVRVKQLCGFSESSWSQRMSFTTPYGVRYQEDFSSATRFADWGTSADRPDSLFAKGSFVTHQTSSSYFYWSLHTKHSDVFPTQHALCDSYSSNQSAWLISPVIDLTPNANDGLLLSFDLALAKYSSSDGTSSTPSSTNHYFYVVVSEDGGETWSGNNATVWGTASDDYMYSDLGLTPRRYTLDMSSYAGKRIQIGFCAETKTSATGDNDIMIDNIDLTTTTFISYNDTICEFEDYDKHGLSYQSESLHLGLNEYHLMTENYDTVTYLSIYVNPMPMEEVYDTICEGELYSKYGFVDMVATTSGAYNHYVENVDGCDSVFTLHLTVIPKQRVTVRDTLCDGSVIVINGKEYYKNSTFADTLTSVVTGCDSIVTYILLFTGDAQLHTDVYATICAGERYRDDLFSETETGVYAETTASVSGCDSIVVLHLFVADAEGALYDTIRVEQLPYIYDGRELIPANADKDDYSFPLESVIEGCEPTLFVHIDRGNALSNIVAENLELAPNPVTVGEAIHVMTALTGGEFTATVYNAIGQEVYTLSEFTTDLPGLPASGIYMVRIQSGKTMYEGKVLVK